MREEVLRTYAGYDGAHSVDLIRFDWYVEDEDKFLCFFFFLCMCILCIYEKDWFMN